MTIEPGRISGRQCHGCGAFMIHDQPTVMIGIVRAGVEKSMLVILCQPCSQHRLGDLACANVSRRDLATFFATLAEGGGLHVNG